jgi:hypothetical protein
MKPQTLQPSLFQVILDQHARIEELFQVVETSKGAEKREAFKQLAELLERHEAAEREIVHPLAAQSIDEGVAVTEERLEEEDEASEMLAGLVKAGPSSAAFDEELQALRLAVLEHATREERYEFKHLAAHRSPEELAELATRFQEFQDSFRGKS